MTRSFEMLAVQKFHAANINEEDKEMDRNTINLSDYGITPYVMGIVMYIPTFKMSAAVLKRMMELGGYASQSSIAKKLGLSISTVSRISQSKARLDLRQIDLFLKKHPGISVEQIFNGYAAHEESVPVRPASLPAKSSAVEKEMRQRFLINAQGFLRDNLHLSFGSGVIFRESFLPEEQTLFLKTGFLPEKWLKIIISAPDYEKFLEIYFRNIHDIRTVKIVSE